MAFDSTNSAVLIATLAQVEAGGNYGTITAPDTLSLGIGQWTQGRAYDLLMKFPSGTNFGSTVASWLSQGRGSWTISARKYQYLNANDRSSLSSALSSPTGKKIQDKQMLDDLNNSYIPRCRELGMNPDTETEACMLLIVVMHRWGNYARILTTLANGAGHPATLDSMAAAIRNSGEWNAVGQRYNIAYRMIKNKETNGLSVDPGETGGDSGGQVSRGESVDNGGLTHITAHGDGTLRLHYSDKTVTAYPTSTHYWKISGSQASTGGGTIPTPLLGGGSGKISEMTTAALNSRGKFIYHQWFEPRLKPDESGVSDCSGFCWWLYHKYMGIDINRNGTAYIFNDPTGKVIAAGSGTFNAVSQIQEGDLIVCRWWSGGGHIEYCTQTGADLGVGMRGPDGYPGPTGPSAMTSMFRNCEWKLKRYV